MTDMTDFEMQLLAVLDRIARGVETIALSNATEPAFVKPLADYRDFDWSTIGATVTEQDRDGATVVEWGGYSWKRRNPSNNFADAIFYTRPTGKDPATGNNKYARLITFKDLGKVKAINRDTEAVLVEKTATRPTEPATTRPAPAAVRVEHCPVCGQPFPLHAPGCSTLKRESSPSPIGEARAPLSGGRGAGGEGGSELDKYFPRPTQPALPIEQPTVSWPTTKAQFMEWLKAKKINGQETRSALGTDADSWLRMNQGRTWADVAKTISSTLAK